ncbi:MAG: hypothetical protein WCK58_18850 [Chloroflexota bacterium]
MRITDSSLDLASSHSVSASLEGHRQVAAWDKTGRVDLGEDVKVTLSGADAAERLRASAQQLTQTGRGVAMPRMRQASLPRVTASPLRQGAPAPAAAASAATAGSAAAASPSVDNLSLANTAWLLLLRLTGDADAASRLAARIAQLAQQVEPKSQVNAAMQQLASQYAASAAGSGAAQAQPAPPPAPVEDWGYREDVSVTVTETEQTAFAAAGSVTTADGRQINVAAAFRLVRAESVNLAASVRLGQAAHDPLALSFAAAAPGLGDGTQQVDVNNDGTAETVASLASTTRYLVRDLNGNGTIDNGSEMFGPATQDGFAELAALDGDRNGWVDEGDAAFAQLALWSGNEGDALVSLKDAGVGAMAASSVATQYEYGAQTGTLAASSVFLYEDGRAGIAGELKLYA